MKRTIELYGLLKEAGGPTVEVELPDDATAADALAALKAVFKDRGGSLTGAALASEDSVLASTDRLPRSGRLAALPPVCGG